jgi:TRAP transporter TAXI family solute receptor
MTISVLLRKGIATLGIGACALVPLSGAVANDGDSGATNLPGTMTWSSYDIGSAGYAEASAIADALGKKYGTRIRIQPSGSAVGRLEPLLRGRAQVGFLATETFFASEGVADFAARRWGPQDLRVIAGRPSSFGVFTARDADIKTLKQLKGQRVAYTAGNPSTNLKCDAFLAFAGLTRDDVNAIMFPTYSATMSSLAQGKADAACTTPTTSQTYELAESPRGIRWLELSPDNKAGWARLQKVAPFFQPYEETIGGGISEDEPVDILAYRYPMMVVPADADDDFVYNYLKALDQAFPEYKDATAAMKRWALDRAGTPPIDVPFHPGAIRYLKEKGIWTDKMQQWNDQRLARLKALRAAWKEAVAEGQGKSDEAFAKIWEKNRQHAIDTL